MRSATWCALCTVLALAPSCAVRAQGRSVFTHADTLRGSNTPQRAWWDVTFYDLHVSVNPADSSIRGHNAITYRALRTGQEMQIDLQPPHLIDSVVQGTRTLVVRDDGNAHFVVLAAPQRAGRSGTITVYYHGKYGAPTGGGRGGRGGGFRWAADSLGSPWISTSNEGPGASTWWPVKDYPADEPDSQRIAITLPDPIVDVSNGRLRSTTHNGDGTTTYEWFVANPINTYDVSVNANANYLHFSDVFDGEKGRLSLDFWPLSYHLDVAKVQFQQAKPMLKCFEHWFGPYPWYTDGYKLIEASYLGMEHQSGIAYGNRYLQGYTGRDLSGTGIGMSWDYIIVHESAHEWWGNSISAKDHADMWIHESFGMYAEGLYTECQQGKEAGEKYLIGIRSNIRNDMPIIGTYGVHDTPSSQDRYYKGSNMLMTMRAVVNDDARWLRTLRGLNATFWHQTVTAAQVRDYMSKATGVDLGRIFRQYLETTMIPVLEYKIDGSTLSYRWANVVAGFDMPVRVTLSDGAFTRMRPTERWQTVAISLKDPAAFHVDDVFYVTARNVR